MSQRTSSLLFGGILFHLFKARNKLLVNHSIMNFFFFMNVPGVIAVYKTVRNPNIFSVVTSIVSEYSKIDESGNTY